MSEYQHIKLEIDEGVATITLRSPTSLNALHQSMRFELMDAIDQLENTEAVRVVVLAGEGKAFCAGADLSEGMPGHDNFMQQCEAEYKPWLMGIHDSSKVYIAAVQGAAAGIGSAVVMNCDMVVMAEDAYIYQAFSAIGLIPDGGATWLLLQKLGYQKAFEMAANAGRLSSQECLDIGLANKRVPNEDLMEVTLELAKQFSHGAPLAQRALKKLMRRAAHMTYSEVIDEEARLQSELIQSEDSRSAVDAFFKKQKPIFKGK